MYGISQVLTVKSPSLSTLLMAGPAVDRRHRLRLVGQPQGDRRTAEAMEADPRDRVSGIAVSRLAWTASLRAHRDRFSPSFCQHRMSAAMWIRSKKALKKAGKHIESQRSTAPQGDLLALRG